MSLIIYLRYYVCWYTDRKKKKSRTPSGLFGENVVKINLTLHKVRSNLRLVLLKAYCWELSENVGNLTQHMRKIVWICHCHPIPIEWRMCERNYSSQNHFNKRNCVLKCNILLFLMFSNTPDCHCICIAGGRKAGTITTQGGSACFKQQAEAPTGCWHEQRNLDGSIAIH